MLLKPGTTILDGKYRVEAFVGKGASSEVYRARHLALRQIRALKVLRRYSPGVGSTEFGDYHRRFEFEAQLGAQINSSNLVQVYDFIVQGEEMLMLVMEYAPGGSLADRLARQRESRALMPIEEAVGIGLDVANGLAVLHARDAVHRDLKPSNILFDAEGHAKVADLGLAQVPGGPSLRSQLSTAMPHPGTPAYMSPEQASTSAYLTPASDIYSLGLVFFEMLTGRAYKNVRPGTRSASLRPEIPPALDDLLARMLAKDPEARSFDGAETLQQLRASGVTPVWNRDEEWQRQLFAAGAVEMLPPSEPIAPEPKTPASVPSPAPMEQPIAAAAVTSASIPATAPARPAPAMRKSRLALAMSLGVLAVAAAGALMVFSILSPATVPPELTATSPRPSLTPEPTAESQPSKQAARSPVPTIPVVEAAIAIPDASATPTATPTARPTPKPPTRIPVTPTPAVADFDGTWYSNFAELDLVQRGNSVEGKYIIYGTSQRLSLQGRVTGNRLEGRFGLDSHDRVTLEMSRDGRSFGGQWLSGDGKNGQWCGVRSGQLPVGCGFSGRWELGGSFTSPNRVNPGPYSVSLVQEGSRVRGSYTDEENNRVDLDGRIGSGGYRLSGTRTWYTRSGRLGGRGTFAWELVDNRSNQFRGWIAGTGSRKERCGWRSGFTQPIPCKLS